MTSYPRFAGTAAILAGITGFLYSLSFIVIARSNPATGALLSGLFLLVGGFLTLSVSVELFQRLRVTNEGFALLALLLSVTGALGAMLHGGYDLANAINVPAENAAALANLPSQVDPRGLMTFGIAGMGVLEMTRLMRLNGGFPSGLTILGGAVGLLLMVIYVGRLIVLDATSPVIVIPALLTGFILNPLWYLWLGLTLRSEKISQRA